jgi:hypothetical protein
MSTMGVAGVSERLRQGRRIDLKLERQGDFEARAASRIVHGVNIPAVKTSGGSTNRESKADADDIAFRTAPLELLEQVLRVAGRKARSVICDGQ